MFRGVVVATVLAGGLIAGAATAVHADLMSSSTPTSTTSVAAPPAARAETAAAAETAATAASCFSTYLAYGRCGTCVKALQKRLGGLSVDGVYGSATRSRVRAFQDDAGIGVDGKVGPQTWRKLRTYGMALGWKAGVTVYMCKDGSKGFRYSTCNNSGKNAYWTFYTTASNQPIYGEPMFNNRIETQGWVYTGTYNSTKLMVSIGTSGDPQTTTSVRDFSSSSLPACV